MGKMRGPWKVSLFGVRVPWWLARRLVFENEVADDRADLMREFEAFMASGRPLDEWTVRTVRAWLTGRHRVCLGRLPLTPWMRELPVVIE